MSACWIRRRQNPYAGVRAASCVDHISPHRGNAALFWDEANNWQALCAACHLAKTRAGL